MIECRFQMLSLTLINSLAIDVKRKPKVANKALNKSGKIYGSSKKILNLTGKLKTLRIIKITNFVNESTQLKITIIFLNCIGNKAGP